MAKKKRATWFKIFIHQKVMIMSADDKEVGKALKAAMQYFDTREEPGWMPKEAAMIFADIRQYIDEAFDDYDMKVQSGRMGAQRRWASEDI